MGFGMASLYGKLPQEFSRAITTQDLHLLEGYHAVNPHPLDKIWITNLVIAATVHNYMMSKIPKDKRQEDLEPMSLEDFRAEGFKTWEDLIPWPTENMLTRPATARKGPKYGLTDLGMALMDRL